MTDSGQRAVCIVRAGADTPPTFIQARIRLLPARVEVIGGMRMHRDSAGRRIGPGLPARLASGLAGRLLGLRLGPALNARALARFLRKRGIDVVLAESGLSGALVQSACRRAGVPLVISFHGRDAYDHEVLAAWGDAYRRAFGVCSAVIADSTHMAAQLERLGAPASKIHVNPCGAETDRFLPTDPAANPPLFVAVGRFVEKKAPHLTLVAFRRVLDACPEARLLMVGDGPLLPACRDIAMGLGMAEAVELPGRLAHEKVAEAMAGARAFVQHSVTAANGDTEGTPVAVMEAGAAGLPVVSTRHGGIPDVVLEGETGFLVDERDVDGMAGHMAVLAGEAALAGRLGRAARERVAAKFSTTGSVATLWRILQKAMGTR